MSQQEGKTFFITFNEMEFCSRFFRFDVGSGSQRGFQVVCELPEVPGNIVEASAFRKIS